MRQLRPGPRRVVLSTVALVTALSIGVSLAALRHGGSDPADSPTGAGTAGATGDRETGPGPTPSTGVTRTDTKPADADNGTGPQPHNPRVTSTTPTPTQAGEAQLTLGAIVFQIQNPAACFTGSPVRRTHGLVRASGAISFSKEPDVEFRRDHTMARLTAARTATVSLAKPWSLTVHIILALGDLDVEETTAHREATTVARFIGGHSDCAGYLAYEVRVEEETG